MFLQIADTYLSTTYFWKYKFITISLYISICNTNGLCVYWPLEKALILPWGTGHLGKPKQGSHSPLHSLSESNRLSLPLHPPHVKGLHFMDAES